MFASQDYPDFAFRTDVGSNQFDEAVSAGDIVQLDQLIQDLAPTYSQFLADNPDLAALLPEADGGIYRMKGANIAEWTYNLRDCWFINKDWLEELNMEKPTTMDQFTEYLRAVRDNRGTGTIPENAVPFYLRHEEVIGGPQDVYGSFGLFCGTASNYVEDGQVKHNYTNPLLKDAIKQLNSWYEEGLILPEMFTDDWGTYTAKLTSETPLVGSIGSHNNNGVEYWDYLAPLDTGNGNDPYIRTQTKSFSASHLYIFSNCEYPAAIVRMADWMVSTPENAVR